MTEFEEMIRLALMFATEDMIINELSERGFTRIVIGGPASEGRGRIKVKEEKEREEDTFGILSR